MTWVRLDDGFPDHPKIVEAGGDAAWLYVCALAYCARHLTDGRVPEAVIARLSDRAQPLALAARLVEVGLWERTPGGYRVHDYLDFQPAATDVRRERAATTRRQAEWRARRNGVTGPLVTPLVTADVTGE